MDMKSKIVLVLLVTRIVIVIKCVIRLLSVLATDFKYLVTVDLRAINYWNSMKEADLLVIQLL